MVPETDWFSSPCTDAALMGKLVQTVVLPETPTVPGMEMPALGMHPLQNGKRHVKLTRSHPFYTVNISHECLIVLRENIQKTWSVVGINAKLLFYSFA